MTVIFLLLAAGLGMLLSLQPAINSVMAMKLGNPLIATSFSIGISLVLVLFAWITLGRAEAQWQNVSALPWWVLIGGAAGALFVFGGVALAPRLGVAVFFTCVVTGQVIGAALADQFGAFGLEPRAIDWPRIIGIALVISGAALTQASLWRGN